METGTIECPVGWSVFGHCFKRPNNELNMNGDVSPSVVLNGTCRDAKHWNGSENKNQETTEWTITKSEVVIHDHFYCGGGYTCTVTYPKLSTAFFNWDWHYFYHKNVSGPFPV